MRHFYVYNECHSVLLATVEFERDGEVATVTSNVPSGNQTLMCVTGATRISCAAECADGSLRWEKIRIDLTSAEYTHVLTCDCPAGADCPQPWPNPITRQSPIQA